MTHQRWKVITTFQTPRGDELRLIHRSLFYKEDFSACLLSFPPGRMLRRPCREHDREVFDVLTGTGIVLLLKTPVTNDGQC